jgi:hypothetical protein
LSQQGLVLVTLPLVLEVLFDLDSELFVDRLPVVEVLNDSEKSGESLLIFK